MKYVVMKVGGQEMPVIFPNHMVHVEVAGAIKAMYAAIANAASGNILSQTARQEVINSVQAISAGDYNQISGECSGSSSTLNLPSRGKADTRLIAMHDYTGGYVG